MRNQTGFVFVVFNDFGVDVQRENIYTLEPHIFGQVKHETALNQKRAQLNTPEAPVREEKEVHTDVSPPFWPARPRATKMQQCSWSV